MKHRYRRLTQSAALLALGVVLVSSCGRVAVDTTDSESHFLVLCEGDTCAEGLSCVCGVCTRPCEADDACAPLGDGVRCEPLATSACAGGEAPRACEVACDDDAECALLGGEHRCVFGHCRASSAGATSAALAAPNRLLTLPMTGECCPGLRLAGLEYEVSTDCQFSYQAPSELELARCQTALPACGDPLRVDGVDLQAALLHPDVEAALYPDSQPGPTLIHGWGGLDPAASPRVVNFQYVLPPGRVFEASPEDTVVDFTVRYFDNDCAPNADGVPAPADCVPQPPGIRALTQLLDTLAMQQRAVGECAPSPGCYAPVDSSISFCAKPLAPYSWDPRTGRCEEAPSCGENSFETQLQCEQSCHGDPCAQAKIVSPEACDGVAAPLWDSDPPTVHCFANEAQACSCSCAVRGSELEACRVVLGGEGALLARCGP